MQSNSCTIEFRLSFHKIKTKLNDRLHMTGSAKDGSISHDLTVANKTMAFFRLLYVETHKIFWIHLYQQIWITFTFPQWVLPIETKAQNEKKKHQIYIFLPKLQKFTGN